MEGSVRSFSPFMDLAAQVVSQRSWNGSISWLSPLYTSDSAVNEETERDDKVLIPA